MSWTSYPSFERWTNKPKDWMAKTDKEIMHMSWVSNINSGSWTDPTEVDQGNDPGSQSGTSDAR